MPITFTNVWDNSTPADTEPANLYAKNLRDFRTDVQQRMAAMSGADANKPTFEAGFAGVLYFATDTGRIFQWSGSTWTDVTLQILGPPVFKDATPNNTKTGSTLQLVMDLLVPAGDINASTRFRLEFFYTTGSAGTVNILQNIYSVGGTPQHTIMGLSSTGVSNHSILIEGGNFGSTTSQSWGSVDLASPVESTFSTTPINMSTDVAFPLYFQGTLSNSTATFYGMTIELF